MRDTACFKNHQRRLPLSRPTAAPTATQLRVVLTLHLLPLQLLMLIVIIVLNAHLFACGWHMVGLSESFVDLQFCSVLNNITQCSGSQGTALGCGWRTIPGQEEGFCAFIELGWVAASNWGSRVDWYVALAPARVFCRFR